LTAWISLLFSQCRKLQRLTTTWAEISSSRDDVSSLLRHRVVLSMHAACVTESFSQFPMMRGIAHVRSLLCS